MATAKKKELMKPEDLLRQIRDKHFDEKAGDLSFIHGDAVSDNWADPRMYFPTGLTLLDKILGNGGFGSGRICEVYGPNRTAKSELAQKCLENFLKTFSNGIGFYWDQEGAVDEKKKQTIFQGRVSWEWSPYAERCFKKVIDMANEIQASAPTAPIFIVIDSLAGLETKEEMEKGLDEVASMAAIARLLSRTFRKLKPVLQHTNCFLMILNQIRHKPGQPAFVDDESPGGEALKFWADYRIKTSNAGTYYFKKVEGSTAPPDGLLVKYKTIKNKLAPPLRTITMPVLFSSRWGCPSGLSEAWSVFDQLGTKGIKEISARGGRYFLKVGEEDMSFTREEWPMIWQSQRTKIMPLVDRWGRAMMLESDEQIVDLEDHDLAGNKVRKPMLVADESKS